MKYFVARPGFAPDADTLAELTTAAAEACPSWFDSNDDASMLPRRPVTGRCRLCGRIAKLTKEHIPPRSSGNTATGRVHTFEDWLSSEDRKSPVGGTTEQGGRWGYTLCRECNSATGRMYGAEYKGWVARAARIFRDLPPLAEIDRNPMPFGVSVQFGSKSDGGVAPGAFVRQVLSCMCSLSSSWDVAERHPELRGIVLEQELLQLPGGLHLGMELLAGPHSRINGPQLKLDTERLTWAWVLELAHPPLAFTMILASNIEAPDVGLDLAPLTMTDPTDRVAFEADFLLGFSWTPYAGDYRSSAALGWDPPSE